MIEPMCPPSRTATSTATGRVNAPSPSAAAVSHSRIRLVRVRNCLLLLALAGCGDGGVTTPPVPAPTPPAEATPPPPEFLGPVVLEVDFDNWPEGAYGPAEFRQDFLNHRWFVGWDEGRTEIVQGALRVTYPALEVGTAVQALITLPDRYDELFLSYRVRFGEGFDFVLGGKLPGLAGGEANAGGDVPTGSDGWSARVMWRADGTAMTYLYHPDQAGKYGDNLHYDRKFVPGRWHTIEHRFVMNTPQEGDGLHEAWFDGEPVLRRTDLRFRDTDAFGIDWLYFATFFGGADSSWATTKEEHADFDDFVVSTERIRPSNLTSSTDSE